MMDAGRKPPHSEPVAGRLWRAALIVGFLATLTGLPLAVAWRASGDLRSLASAMTRPRDALILTSDQNLSPRLGLVIHSGVISGARTGDLRTDRPVPRLDIDSAVFTLDLTARGDEPGPAQAPAGADLDKVLQRLANLSVASIGLRRVTLDIRHGDGAMLHFTDMSGEIVGNGDGAFTTRAKAQLAGNEITLEATWSRPAATAAPGAGHPLQFKITSSLLTAAFTGTIRPDEGLRLDGRADVRSRKLRALARWFGVPVKTGADLRNATVSGEMTWAKGLLSFPKAAVAVDGNAGTGVVSLATGGARPKVDATLAFDKLTVTPYLASLLQAPTDVPDTTAHRTLLALFDADLRLSAGKLVAPLFNTGGGAVTLTLKQGRLLADLAELELEGGLLGGQVSLDVSGDKPQLALKLRAKGIDPGRIFADALKRNPLLGRADLTIEAAGSAPTIQDLMPALAGRGTIRLIDGGRLGLDLKALAYGVRQARTVDWTAAGKGTTPLDRLEARFQIAAGNLVVEALDAASGPTLYLAGGSIDLIRRELDLTLGIGLGPVHEAPISARELIGFRGPWGSPAIGIVQSSATLHVPAAGSELLDTGMLGAPVPPEPARPRP